jgi:replicative DNA helicase Mcm
MNATQNTEFTDQVIEFFRNYYRNELGKLAQRYPQDQKSLYVDYNDIYRFSPDLADDLRAKPRETLEAFDEGLRLYELPVDISLSEAKVRVYNLPESYLLDVAEVSRHENIDTLLDVRGQVQKVTDVKPRPEEAAFECQRCGTLTRVPQQGYSLQQPHECQGCERQGPFCLNRRQTEWTNHQTARIQQPPERTKGGKGETIDAHLKEDLIREFDAGDRVILTGILDIKEVGNDQSLDFDTTIDTRSVVREESDYEDIDVDKHLDDIEAIASGEKGDPYELLIDSINPEHHGDEDVKLAIALQMFGGWSRGGRKRGDSHILLMGDPGCGKSTFLQAVDELAPRSTYASGKGATAAGLTAAAVADDFGDTKWGLEAGALVLADGGIACIDEIDKVDEKAVSSLHDALESQKVRVNKAGINATLNSRTAMLAAGNPEYGRFDRYESLAQQIDLGPTLMSRFDLMFMVNDSPDRETDQDVIDHMMDSRRAAAKKALGEKLTEAERQSSEPAISVDTLRAYIAYAKEEVTPYIHENNDDAREHLKEEFLKLRLANAHNEDNPVPVTYRQEEAIERLAEASARVRLSDEVTKADVDRALSLVQKSMQQVGIDPETGEFDADIIETGQSKSQRDRIQNIIGLIEELDGPTREELIDEAEDIGIEAEKVENEISRLKDNGQVVEVSGDKIRKV